ncbi:MAG TPA: DNA polymerase III subunit alpha [Solirubrobacteraceae bacterium]
MSGTPPYVELHCHSAYSFLDGVSLPDELVQRASELGHGALALTDHNSVSGSMELAQATGKGELRAIHGAEIDLAPVRGSDEPGEDGRSSRRVPDGGRPGSSHGVSDGRPSGGRHLTLLVREARGWSNLCRILTLAHAHTREGRERSEPSVALETVLEHAEGLVCLTGCAERGVHDEPTARRLLDTFGPEGLRVELQRPYARHDRARNRALAALGRRLGVACVASGDVHAHVRTRAELQDAFVALRLRSTLEASEPRRRGNHSHVMSTPQAMASRFVDHPEAVRETLHLAEELTFDLCSDLGYRYPGAEDESSMRRLVELCQARLEDRYGPGLCAADERAAAEGRLREELQVIDELGLAGFFLLHHEVLELAREVAVEIRGVGGANSSPRTLLAPGRGRGSSVSSIVCYLTGLSHIDPIRNRLLLGRFLHTGLESLPDIDLDFPRDIREVLIPRVHERFGHERAALVAAFPTFRVRGAIRELGKVLGLPAGEIERVARGADGHGPAQPGAAHPESTHPESAQLEAARPGVSSVQGIPTDSPRWRWLERLVAEAQRLPRHLSQHPGGMVISTRPLIDCCPVVPAAMEGRQMVQWDKDSCADAHFLKIDLLGLGMLSAVERCVEEVARTRSQRIDLSRIPFDDAETFKAIRRADTVGVFQIESRAQMQSLRRTLPLDLDDLTVQVAIVRPGPIQGGAINPYIERRRRLREDPGYEIPYEHPALEPVLESTLGTVIFQDQVMEVAQAFAGFSPREADGLRRVMSRKRSHEMLQEYRESFVAGARRHVGAEEQTAERVWEMVAGFAGFGFPKAHGAAFGLLAYQSTWLRVHYGPEFLCALLNEQPMGFYASDTLVHEAEHRGIPVLGLDVNASAVQCTVESVPADIPHRTPAGRGSVQIPDEAEAQSGQGGGGGGDRLGVRLGLGYIKGVLAAEVQALVAERERGGPFGSLGELAARVGASRATLEQLAWSGACDGLVESSLEVPARTRRREALWQLGVAATGRAVAGGDTQLALPLELTEAPRLRPLSRWQRLIADYATSGVTVGDHVMAALRPRLRTRELTTSAQLARLPSGRPVTVAGLVIARQRPGTAKGTMFLLFEDEWGPLNLIVPRAVYERHRHLARAEPLLLAHGRLERAGETQVVDRLADRRSGDDRRNGGRKRGEGMTAGERSSGAPESGQEQIPPVVNVIVRELVALERFLDPADGGVLADGEQSATRARVHHLPDSKPSSAHGGEEEEEKSIEVGSSMRAVAPPVQSFAQGRRR